MPNALPSPCRTLLWALVVLAALVGTATAQPRIGPVQPVIDPLRAPWHAEFVAAANAARHAAGLPSQRPDDDLANAAQIHAEEMAALGYFSHASPTEGRATPTARVALVGGPQIAVAENLALIGGAGDLVKRTIDGWLASPGHRGNLLLAEHDAVGFGLARNDRGESYVVQVTAAEPPDLRFAEVVRDVRTEFRIVATVHAEHAVDAVVAFGDDAARPVSIARGSSEIALVATESRPRQLRIGVPLAGGAGYALDEAAWIEPATGVVEPDATAPRRFLRITGARSDRVTEVVARVRLHYQTGIRPLALFVDGVHVPGAESTPGTLEVAVPSGRATTLSVGVVDGGRATFFHRFVIEPVGDEGFRIVPGATGDEGS